MLRRSVLAAAFVLAVPVSAQAQTAQSVLADVVETQQERLSEVTNYTIEQRPDVAPMSAPIYYERAEITIDGETLFTMRQVPTAEWSKRATGTEEIGADEYDRMADAYEMTADAMRGTDPVHAWAAGTLDDGAMFYRAAAEAERSGAAYADDDPDAANLAGMVMFARRAELVGETTHMGRPAYHLRADELTDVPLEQPDGAEFTLRSASMWIDREHLVPLQLTMNLDVEAEGTTSPVIIEIRWEDYRSFGPLYEATRQVMSLKGLNALMEGNPEDREKWEEAREEMAKAREQMKEMEEEIAELPANVQGMVRGQMERAMRQMDMLMNEGAIEVVVHRTVYEIDQGPPARWTPTLEPPGSP